MQSRCSCCISVGNESWDTSEKHRNNKCNAEFGFVSKIIPAGEVKADGVGGENRDDIC